MSFTSYSSPEAFQCTICHSLNYIGAQSEEYYSSNNHPEYASSVATHSGYAAVRHEVNEVAPIGSFYFAVSVNKGGLPVVYVGMSWAEITEAVREILLGISSVFPFLPGVRASKRLF